MSDFNLSDMYRMHWAQPIEQQVAADIANMTDEQRMLEGWLNDDVKCESEHSGDPNCSISVTHLATTACGTQGRICNRAYVSNERHRLTGGLCRHCDKPAKDCWTQRPI